VVAQVQMGQDAGALAIKVLIRSLKVRRSPTTRQTQSRGTNIASEPQTALR